MQVRRSLIGATALSALLATSTPLPVAAQSQEQAASPWHNQGFCRTPGPLPELGIESEQFRQAGATRPSPRAAREGTVMASPSAIPAPPAPPPPPSPVAPPPPAMAADSGGAGDVVVTGTAVGAPASESRAAPSPPIMPPRPGPRPRPQPQPQAGLLTAGEHDDLLNPLLYARYVNRSNLAQQIPDLPRVDTARALTVRVTDPSGRPVSRAPVIITCSDGNSVSLLTRTDGTAVFFPDVDLLSREVSISVGRRRFGEPAAAPRRITLSPDAGGQQVNFVTRTAAQAVGALDLAFVIDTTGSMGDEIRYLQSELASIVANLRRRHPNVTMRVGFVFYRDAGDEYVTRTVRFDGDVERAQATLMQQRADGGGDYPEAMDQALIRGVGLDWRPDAVRSLILVADAPPHDQQFGRTWAAAEVARQRGIHIVPVAASGVADKAEYAMRAMAALTQSRYLFLTDDSGIGNPHAPPAVDCYLVTRLDALLRRVIDSQLSGRRIEPLEQEIIRSVGQYDNGRCILPPDFGQDQQSGQK